MKPFAHIRTEPVAVDPLRRPNWKPFVFSPLYILPLASLHILAIVGIQLLIKKNRHDGDEIAFVRANHTLAGSPQSIFVFEDDSTSTFMMWTYLPVAIVVIVAAFWEAVDVQVRRLQPWRQLASAEGGNAWNALCLDYTSLFGLFTPFSALRRKHYAVALVSFINIMASIALPAVAGGIFNIEWGSLTFSSDKVHGTKYAIVTVNPGVALANQVMHGLVLGCGLAISIMLFVQRTGLYRDPRGLGGIASLISDSMRSGSNTTRIFHQIPSFAHSRVVDGALRNVNFGLEHFLVSNPDGSTSWTYQLAPKLKQPNLMLPINPQDRAFYGSRRDASGLWLMKRIAWLAEIFLWLGHAAVTGAIYYSAKILGPDGFADQARPMIGKMVLTVCITVGGMMWVSIQRDIQLMAPWRRLSRDRTRKIYAALEESNLVSEGQFGSAVLSIIRGSATITWASFCVLMIQIATIFVPPLEEFAYIAGVASSLPDYQLMGILKGSSGLGLVITGVAIHLVIFLNLLIFSLGGFARPFLPRAPRTIASQIVYLCRSERLLRDLEGTSMASKKEVEKRLDRAELRCMIGWFWWRQGGVWSIAVEEHEQGAPSQPFNFYRGIVDFHPCT